MYFLVVTFFSLSNDFQRFQSFPTISVWLFVRKRKAFMCVFTRTEQHSSLHCLQRIPVTVLSRVSPVS